MGLLMIAYPITRFLIEYLRNDEGAFIAGLTISQAISVFLLAGRGRLLGLAGEAARGPAGRGGFAVRAERRPASRRVGAEHRAADLTGVIPCRPKPM